jgi:hypothetical protein
MTKTLAAKLKTILAETIPEIIDEIYTAGNDVREIGLERDGQAIQEIGTLLDELDRALIEKHKDKFEED